MPANSAQVSAPHAASSGSSTMNCPARRSVSPDGREIHLEDAQQAEHQIRHEQARRKSPRKPAKRSCRHGICSSIANEPISSTKIRPCTTSVRSTGRTIEMPDRQPQRDQQAQQQLQPVVHQPGRAEHLIRRQHAQRRHRKFQHDRREHIQRKQHRTQSRLTPNNTLAFIAYTPLCRFIRRRTGGFAC